MPFNSSIDRDNRIAVIVGIVLLLATYLAFSIRSVTDPLDPGELLSTKRFVVAAVGSGLFWVVVRYARKDWAGRSPERLVGVALMSVAALGFVLATRIGYDLLITGETEAMLVRNLRWTIIWLGYFGTALLGYFAIVFNLSLRRTVPLASGTRQDRVAAVFTEVATWSASERRMLAAMLDDPDAYECADPLFAAWQRP
jgi:hypothetical protein